MNKILISLLVFLITITVGLLGLLVYVSVDSTNIDSTNTTTTVVEIKKVIPAHTTTMLVGKMFLPQFHPESYRIQFKIGEDDHSFSVEKQKFDQIEVGELIEVDYGSGRLSKSNYPTEIRKISE